MESTWRRGWSAKAAAALVAVALGALAWTLPGVRRDLIQAIVKWDARPTAPAPLPAGTGAGLVPAARPRVVLIDGLAEDVARTLPAWSALCRIPSLPKPRATCSPTFRRSFPAR